MTGLTRSPPMDMKAERSVLALMMATGQPYRVAGIVAPADFFAAKHQTIYRAISETEEVNEAIDANTVHGACRDLDPEWDDWSLIRDIQTEAKQGYAKAENLEFYAQIVADMSLRREYIAASVRISDGIFADDMNDVGVDVFVESQLREINDRALRQEAEIRPFVYEEYDDLSAPILTTSTGYPDIDKYTNGLCAPDLFVLTGESGTGKTTLAMNMVANAARRGNVSAIFSMEMSRKQLLYRLIASEGRVPLKKVQRQEKDIEDKCAEAYKRIVDSGCFYVDDHSSRTVSEIKTQALKVKHKVGKLDIIVVDYIGRMKPEDPGQNRNQQVGDFARGLKSIAKALNCNVLCLAQLNREGRLRDSGEIDHEADVILHMERAEGELNLTDLTTRKSRHAEPGSFQLKFQGQFNRFDQFTPDDVMVDRGYI